MLLKEAEDEGLLGRQARVAPGEGDPLRRLAPEVERDVGEHRRVPPPQRGRPQLHDFSLNFLNT